MGALFVSHGSKPVPFVPIGAVARADDAPKTDDAPEKAAVFLETYCSGCHGEGKRLSRRAWIDRKAYKNLVDIQKLITPGKSDDSELYTCMIRPNGTMPPARVQVRPTKEELDAFKAWIDAGAKPWAEPAPAPPAAPAG
jgi:mono/diheme cytochrome c family protein